MASAPPVSTPSTGIDPSRFEELITEVRRLSVALVEQQQAYTVLQTQLQATLSECADLRLQLRASKGKRSRAHSVDATASAPTPAAVALPSAEPSGSEAAMSSAEEEPAPRRRSPTGRTTPPNV